MRAARRDNRRMSEKSRSLFDDAETPGGGAGTPPDDPQAPLAQRLRPADLSQVIGQRHLLGPGKPLRVAFESGRLHSMILWGPPGVGKTTLARLMAGAVDAEFIVLSAGPAGGEDNPDAGVRGQHARAPRPRPTALPGGG